MRIQMSGVNIGDPDAAERLEVRDLALEGGVVYGLIGGNLSGRSAFLRLLGGGDLSVEPATMKGQIVLSGHSNSEPSGLDPTQHSVYLGPSAPDSLSSLMPTVGEEISLHEHVGEGQPIEFSVGEYVGSFGLDRHLEDHPMQLSGGETAGLVVLCALAMRRPILCIDETLAFLDPGLKKLAWQILRKFAAKGAVVAVADNHYDMMAESADQVILMSDKKVVGISLPHQAFNCRNILQAQTIPAVTRLASSIWPGSEELPITYTDMCLRLSTFRPASGSEPSPSSCSDENNTALTEERIVIEENAHPKRITGNGSIVVDSIDYSYRGSADECALGNVSAIFHPGCATALIGPNGAGKSTLCRILNGVLRAKSGVIRKGGRKMRPFKRPGFEVAYAFQNPDDQLFLPTVKAELEYGPKFLGMSKAEIDTSVTGVANLLDLEACLGANPLDLPFVLRKRVSIAAAITMKRPFTVLDEPTVGQDPAYCCRLANAIKSLCEAGFGFIIVSHDPEFVFQVCDDIVTLSEGRNAWSGTKENSLVAPQSIIQDFAGLTGKIIRDLCLPADKVYRLGLVEYFRRLTCDCESPERSGGGPEEA